LPEKAALKGCVRFYYHAFEGSVFLEMGFISFKSESLDRIKISFTAKKRLLYVKSQLDSCVRKDGILFKYCIGKIC